MESLNPVVDFMDSGLHLLSQDTSLTAQFLYLLLETFETGALRLDHLPELGAIDQLLGTERHGEQEQCE